MRLLLAPMEGLLDFVLRDVLTSLGGADRCVSEFIRITGSLLPDKVYLRTMPELRNGSCTAAGTPVRAQLLGSDAASMAANAAQLAALSPEGIDLNFGCPAKVVNRHGGGAALLQDPAAIHAVVSAVRAAVPAAMPVSAKMRLGFNDRALMLDCALAMQEAGACELVVHGRTKLDGYRPPAYWDQIARIREAVTIPVVANGEIWTVEDALRCQAESGCQDLMLGRGIVADPGLAWRIRKAVAERDGLPMPDGLHDVQWPDLVPALLRFWQLVCDDLEPRQRAGRLKQWLNLMRRAFPEAEAAYQHVRVMTDQGAITLWLDALQQQTRAGANASTASQQ
ncbi:tRNA-dihydrouridine synthase C [Comamonas sp. BIGb0152]|uniref:tRNA dihydrouridine synthase n=1 Tax=Comamonas sp. BIGb0152 TaxID=2940601 RepID=UPI0021684EB5|nr:tRNA-dihydrouridine synthase [Comamonas sp. BIGb0152]MCS4295348.1 tRNA-dihydrouridine synthase C [Comamonas sp. BIGb0152]